MHSVHKPRVTPSRSSEPEVQNEPQEQSNLAASLARTSAAPSYIPHAFSQNGHTASAFGYLKIPLRISGGTRELVRTTDGGTLALHWWSVQRAPWTARVPIVLLIHGINNSSETPYIQYMAAEIEASGFLAVMVNMRGHGRGNDLTSGRLYTARADDDIQTVCQHIRLTRKPPRLFAIGFSMGANQLICFLGSQPHLRLVDAAISVSCPFDLSRLSHWFQRGIPRLYTLLIAQPLKRMLWRGRHSLPLSSAQLLRGLAATSVGGFDASVQAISSFLCSGRFVETAFFWIALAQWVRSLMADSRFGRCRCWVCETWRSTMPRARPATMWRGSQSHCS